MSMRAKQNATSSGAAAAAAEEAASDSDSDSVDDVELLSEPSNAAGGGGADDFPDQDEFGTGGSGGRDFPDQVEFGAGGGGSREFGAGGGGGLDLSAQAGKASPIKAAADRLDTGAKASLQVKLSLRKFASAVQEYEADAITAHGLHLQVFGAQQSKPKAVPERAQLLRDVLAEIGINAPNLLEHLTTMGFNNKEIKTATESVKMLLVVRDAVDEGRLLTLTQERSMARQPAGSGEGREAAPASPAKPATRISVKFQTIDKDSHKDRVDHPPGGPWPTDAEQLVKDAVTAIVHGIPSKAADLFAAVVRKLDQRGIATKYLFSMQTSLAATVTDGLCPFGGPSSGDSSGLTFQITSGPSAPSDTDWLQPLPAKFSRDERLAEEAALVNDIHAGTQTVPGGVRDEDTLFVHLGAHAHRVLSTRGLVQQTLATILVKVLPGIKFNDPLEHEAIMNIVHVYAEALKGGESASNLATATELGGPLSPMTVVLAKAVGPHTNIATNLVTEITRALTDPYSVRYVSRISHFAMLLPKQGESAQDFFRKAEALREDLKSLQRPQHVNLEAIGFTVDPLSQLPVMLSSSNMNIMKTADHCFVSCVSADHLSRTREVINHAFFVDARGGNKTKAQLNAALSQMQDMKIPTVCKVLRDESKQQRPIGQVNAFAAVPPVPAPGGKGGKGGKGSKPQPQDRGRSTERQHGSASETPRPRSRSPSQQSSVVDAYKQCIDSIKRHGLLKFLQRLHKSCTALTEPLFEVNQDGTIVSPIKLLSNHSWSRFGGRLGAGGRIETGLFAGLMLARDICGHDPDGAGKLTKTGQQHRTSNDSSWTKLKATELRGDLTVVRVLDSTKRKANKGKKTSKIAAVSFLGDSDVDEGGDSN